MDMKKILQAFDGAATKPVQGASDMKKFMSIVRESANPYTPVEENVVTSFEEGSVGGDANAFLIAADTINDEVMGQIDKIKINADPQLLKNLMAKFNEFMSAYHAVGKEILQPDMFDELPGDAISRDHSNESVEQGVAEGKFGLPEPGDMVKHVNGATGKIKKLSWMDGDTYIYFKDENGDMNYGRWEKEVKALKKGVAEGETPDFETRRKGKTPAKLGAADAWYHRAMSPTYYGFEKGTPEYAEYVNAFNDYDEGPSGGKQWESADKGLSFKDYFNLQEAKKGLQ